MLTHFDDVPWQRIDRGPLQGERQRLGPAAGTARVGLSRYRLGPGERAMPVHVHADEEEIFYVLAGSGLSWQGGRTYRVAEGDCIVYLAGAEPHTIIAGAAGLDVLAFGQGSDTNITWLPRAQAWWMGPHWLPSDGPNPFRREADAGPLEPVEPEPQRPPTIVARADVEPEREEVADIASTWLDMARAAGSRTSGLQHIACDAGMLSCPPHCHGAEEEVFVVLEGDGTLMLGDTRSDGSIRPGTGDEHAVRKGHVVARPPGTGVSHCFRGGPGGLGFLAYGTRDTNDIVYYPRSRKVAWRGVKVRARVEPLDYWDGED